MNRRGAQYQQPMTVDIEYCGFCAASQTSSASAQVSAASQTLSSGASEQAASVEETSASLEEMSSMIRSTADNAEKAKALATDAHAVAQALALRKALGKPSTMQVHLINVQRAVSANVVSFVGTETVEEFHQENSEDALAPARAQLQAADCSWTEHRRVGCIAQHHPVFGPGWKPREQHQRDQRGRCKNEPGQEPRKRHSRRSRMVGPNHRLCCARYVDFK